MTRGNRRREGGVQPAVLFLATLMLPACDLARAVPAAPVVAAASEAPAAAEDPFATFLTAQYPVAAGFVSPLDSHWRAVGNDAWESTTTRAIRAMAPGIAAVSADGEVRVRSSWYENFERRELELVVTGLTPVVADGTRVEAGTVLGSGRHAGVRLEGHDEDPREFAKLHDWLPVPLAEAHLVLISHDADELRLYRSGHEVARYDVGFGQAEGQKERRGDNRSPKGVYFITQKARGPFSGDYAEYLGGYWMRVSYPNAFDAARGVDSGWITTDEQRSITRAWRARRETTKHTALGGGIGIHAWAFEWDDSGTHGLSWGCVVMHPRDAEAIYTEMQEGAMVVLF